MLTTPPAPNQSPSLPDMHKNNVPVPPHTPTRRFSLSEKSFFMSTTPELTSTPSTTSSSLSPMNTPQSVEDDGRGVAEEKQEDQSTVRAQLRELQKKLVNYELSEDGFLLEVRKLVSTEQTKVSIIEEDTVRYNRPMRSASTSSSNEEEKSMSGTNGTTQESIKERLKALQVHDIVSTKQCCLDIYFHNASIL